MVSFFERGRKLRFKCVIAIVTLTKLGLDEVIKRAKNSEIKGCEASF